jgi:3-oxoacyl-[acyl-carrier protein] reductase
MSRVAVVTGGTRGIGWAVGRRLRDEGWQVVAADLVPGETEAGDTRIAYRQMDVCDRDQVSSTLAAVVDEHGSLDLLVNNAGITRHHPLVDLTWEDWSAVVDVNLHGVFNCLQAAGRIMIERGGGVIVNMASVAAERGAAGRGAYAATKTAIVGLTRTAAGEWAAHGVRVNAVGPGYVDTGVMSAAVASGTIDPADVLARIPAGRLADPDEIGAMVSFLASPDAAYITGQVFYVDGGFLADYGVRVKE